MKKFKITAKKISLFFGSIIGIAVIAGSSIGIWQATTVKSDTKTFSLVSSKFEKDNDPQNAIIPTKINNNEQSVEILSIPFQTSQAQYLYTNTFTTNNVHEQLELTNIKHDDNAVTKEQAGINVTQSGDSGDSGDQSLIFNKIISGVQVGVDSGMYTFDIVDTCTKNGYFTYILTTHVKYQIIPTDLSNLKINVEKSNITYGYTLAKFKLSVSSNAGYNFIYKLDPRYTDSHFHIIHDANNNYYLQLDTGLNVNKYHFAVYAELPQTNNVKLPNTLDDDIEVRKATIIDGCKIIVNGQHLSNVGDNIHSKINLIYNQSSQETWEWKISTDIPSTINVDVKFDIEIPSDSWLNEGDIYKINNNTIGVKSSIGVTPEDFTQSFFNIKAEVVTFGNYNDYVLIDKKMYLNVERANFNDFTITSNDPILDETNEIDLTSPSTDKKKTYDFETKDFVQVSGATYVWSVNLISEDPEDGSGQTNFDECVEITNASSGIGILKLSKDDSTTLDDGIYQFNVIMTCTHNGYNTYTKQFFIKIFTYSFYQYEIAIGSEGTYANNDLWEPNKIEYGKSNPSKYQLSVPDGSSLPSDANISYVLSANPFSSKISIENDGSDDYLVLANNINVGIYSNILLISSARADDTNKTLLGTCQIRFTIEIIKKQITILPSQIKIGSTAGANDSANAADTQSFAYNPTTTTTTTSLEITVDFTSIDVLHSDISKFTNTFQQTSTEPFPTGVSIDSNSNDKLLIASNANVTSATGFLFSLKATIIENSTSNYVFSSNSAWFNLKISKNKIPTTGVNITLSNDINNGGYAYITGYNTAPEINIEYNSGFLSSSSGAWYNYANTPILKEYRIDPNAADQGFTIVSNKLKFPNTKSPGDYTIPLQACFKPSSSTDSINYEDSDWSAICYVHVSILEKTMKIKKDAGSSHVLYTDTDGDQIGISKTDNHNGDLDINFKTNETVSSNASTKKINEYFNAGLGVIDTATVSLDYWMWVWEYWNHGWVPLNDEVFNGTTTLWMNKGVAGIDGWRGSKLADNSSTGMSETDMFYNSAKPWTTSNPGGDDDGGWARGISLYEGDFSGHMRSNSRITKIRANVGEIEIKPNFLTGKWEIKPNAAGAKEVNVKYYGKCFDDGDIWNVTGNYFEDKYEARYHRTNGGTPTLPTNVWSAYTTDQNCHEHENDDTDQNWHNSHIDICIDNHLYDIAFTDKEWTVRYYQS